MAFFVYTPSAFDRFKREGEIIGRMIIEYGELEWDLCLLIGHITQDINAAFKGMYRIRGATRRIDFADKLARSHLESGDVRRIYEETIADMRVCLKIRNQYAHTNWLDACGDGLCFVKVEEIAKANDVVDISSLPRYKLDLQTIEDQQRFFVQVMQNIQYLCMAVQYRNGSTDVQGFDYVQGIKRPMEAKPL